MLPSLRRAPSALFVALVTVSGLALPGRAAAYCRTTTVPTEPSYRPEVSGCFTEGRSLYWPSRCVGVAVQKKAGPLGDAVTKPLVERAFAAWTRPNGTCSPGLAVTITEARAADDEGVSTFCEGDEVHNVVGFQETGWPAGGRDTLALTTLTFDVDTGEIFGADTAVNATFIDWSTTTVLAPGAHDLESALVHEAGHFLGVAHSPIRDATMFADYQPGTTGLRTLEPDDEDAICTIYPATDVRTRGPGGESTQRVASAACDLAAAQRPSVCAPDGAKSCGCDVTPETSPASAPLAVGLALGLLAAGRGRSRRPGA